MSFWSNDDGKRVLRSSSRIAGVGREASVARNPDDDQELPVARNADDRQQCPQQILNPSDHQAANTETNFGEVAISPPRNNQVKPEISPQMATATVTDINSRLAAIASNQLRSQESCLTVQETINQNILQAEFLPRNSEEIGIEVNVTKAEISNSNETSINENLVEMDRNESDVQKTGNYGFSLRNRTDYICLQDEDFSADPIIDDTGITASNRFHHGGGFAGVPYPAPRLRYWKPGAAAEAASQLPGMKRRPPWKGSGGGKRPRLGPVMPKTAAGIVNERSPGLQYKFSDMIGQPHDPLFHVTVFFPPTGLEYEGSGKSKKLAKNNVAERILADLDIPIPEKESSEEEKPANMEVVETPVPPSLTPTNIEPMATALPAVPNYAQSTDPMPYAEIDFASDDVIEILPQTNPVPAEVVASDFTKLIKRIVKIPSLRENAVAALNLILQPEIPVFDFISEEGPPHEKIFTTELNFLDHNKVHQTFVAKGGSKKKSKLEAATQALISILGPQLFLHLADRSLNLVSKTKRTGQSRNSDQTVLNLELESQENSDPLSEQYNLVFANHVRSLIVEKYDEIMTEDQAHFPQKVIAGVVMTKGFPLVENSSVIAVTTGTKCIEGDHMSDGGLALNDCHAEILATRCLRDFIYSHLEEICFEGLESTEECIFEVVHDGEEGIEKFRLRDEINFHLYISTSPCGDARIFSPKGLECDESELEPPGEELPAAHSNRSNRGVLRAKIEAGEGTIAVANLTKGPQAWDAILQGQALYTMSCSDKVCRWNVVGAQGALLSNFLDPIYYSSIVLGSLHHPIHFERAVFGRVENLSEELALPYKVNKPRLLMTSNDAKRQVKKSPNHAVAWACGWSVHEVLHASKGRCWSPEMPSRLCKRMQFLRFLKIYKNRTGRRDNFADIHYADAKAEATEYKKARNQLMDNFRSNGFGNWITKPLEHDAFKIGK